MRFRKNNKISSKVKSPKSRSILLYLCFVVISAIFWGFITFNKTVQQDVEFQFEITNVPEGVTFIDDAPTLINITVRDKGSAFIRYAFNSPVVKVKFSDFCNMNSGYFKMNTVQLRNAVKKALYRESTIVSILPDAINLKFTNLPGKMVPIRLDLDIDPAIQYVVNGAPILSQDSVMIYSDRKNLSEINEVYTYKVQESGLTDTLRREVTIALINGVKIEPRTVRLIYPVEQLIAKRKLVPISMRNIPERLHFVLLPSSVEVTYLVPKSLYKKNQDDITAVVDFNSIDLTSKSNKAAVMIGECPAVYKNVEVTTDSVEYIIDKR